MRSRIAVAVIAVLLVIYLGATVQHAVVLIGTGQPVAVGEGAALIVLPIIGAWALAAELVFGFRAQRLLARMTELGRLPVDELPHRPSGRPERAAADLEFPKYQAEVEADPSDWTRWYRLALAYDASGDRRRARWATRRAIRVERASRERASR